MTDFVDIHGNPINIGRLQAQTKPKPRHGKEYKPEPKHMGWRVLGHPPGSCEAARRENEAEWRLWNAHDGEMRQQALKDGRRPPAMWDESAWRLRTKKKNVNGRPYDVESAALQCKELAIKAGWEDVEVSAILKAVE